MIKTGKEWPEGAKVLNMSYEDFVFMITGIESEDNPLFKSLLLVEKSLNTDAKWNIL